MGGAGLRGSSITDKAGMLAEKANGTWVYRYESYTLDESSCPTSSSDNLTQANSKYTKGF